MKIEGPGTTSRTAPTRKTSKTSAGSDVSAFEEMLGAGDAPAETSSMAASKNIAMIDSLLTIQAMEDPMERAARQKARKRSGDLLKNLDKIRHGLLTGRLTVGHMIDIADVVAMHRDRVNDPMLTSILDEIDLRAQVEIAKMRYGLDRHPKTAGSDASTGSAIPG